MAIGVTDTGESMPKNAKTVVGAIGYWLLLGVHRLLAARTFLQAPIKDFLLAEVTDIYRDRGNSDAAAIVESLGLAGDQLEWNTRVPVPASGWGEHRGRVIIRRETGKGTGSGWLCRGR